MKVGIMKNNRKTFLYISLFISLLGVLNPYILSAQVIQENNVQETSISVKEMENIIEHSFEDGVEKEEDMNEFKELEKNGYEETFLENEELTKTQEEIIDDSIVTNPYTDEIKLDISKSEEEKLGNVVADELEEYVEETQEQLEDGEFYVNNAGEIEASDESDEYVEQWLGISI